jgi:hypothetical protein
MSSSAPYTVCAATPMKAVEVLRSTSTAMAGTATIK